MKNKTILGASIGNCVHVAGIIKFLDIAKTHGYETMFLGPATSVDVLKDKILKIRIPTLNQQSASISRFFQPFHIHSYA